MVYSFKRAMRLSAFFVALWCVFGNTWAVPACQAEFAGAFYLDKAIERFAVKKLDEGLIYYRMALERQPGLQELYTRKARLSLLFGFVSLSFPERGLQLHDEHFSPRLLPDDITFFSVLVSEDPDNYLAMEYLAIARYLHGDAAQALTELQTLTKALPNDEWTLFNRAAVYAATDDYRQSLKDLDHFQSMGGDAGTKFWVSRAMSLKLTGKHKKALECFNQVFMKLKANPENNLKIDEVWLNAQVAEVYKKMNGGFKKSSLSPEIRNALAAHYLNLGIQALQSNDHSRALIQFDRSLEFGPSAFGYFLRGHVHLGLKQIDVAIFDALEGQRILSTSNGDVDKAAIRAADALITKLAYVINGRDFRTHIERSPKLANAIGELYARLADRMTSSFDAVNTLREALHLEVTDPEALEYIGDVALRQGEYDDALVMYEKALAAGLKKPQTLSLLAWLKYKRQDPFEAFRWAYDHNLVGASRLNLELCCGAEGKIIGFLDEVLSKYPDDQAALSFKAIALEQKGEYGMALKNAELAIAQSPENSELRRLRALLLEELGQPEKALEDYQFLCSSDPNDYSLFTALARVKLARGTPKEAYADVLKALALVRGAKELSVKARKNYTQGVGEIFLEVIQASREKKLSLQVPDEARKSVEEMFSLLAEMAAIEERTNLLMLGTWLIPDSSDLNLLLCGALLEENEDEAMHYFSKVLQKNPDAVRDTWVYRTMAAHLAARFEGQEPSQIPVDLRTVVGDGCRDLASEKTDSAAKQALLQRALALNPGDGEALSFLAATAQEEGDSFNALQLSLNALKVLPAHTESCKIACQAYTSRGDLKRAVHFHYRSYLPQSLSMTVELRELIEKELKAHTGSLQNFMAASDLYPEDIAPFAMAKYDRLVQDGNLQAARKLLEEIIELAPQYYLAQQQLERLDRK